jgi:hypothetical protein
VIPYNNKVVARAELRQLFPLLKRFVESYVVLPLGRKDLLTVVLDSGSSLGFPVTLSEKELELEWCHVSKDELRAVSSCTVPHIFRP